VAGGNRRRTIRPLWLDTVRLLRPRLTDRPEGSDTIHDRSKVALLFWESNHETHETHERKTEKKRRSKVASSLLFFRVFRVFRG
jgi:hypothetical protein